MITMNFEQMKVSPASSLSKEERVRRALLVFGTLKESEREQLLKPVTDSKEPGFGSYCMDIAERQTTIPRVMKWLKLGAEAGSERAQFTYAIFLSHLNQDVIYMRDEAGLWMFLLSHIERQTESLSKLEEYYSRVPRYFIRLLLSGSLSKNQDSVLYRSFFRSSMREVHLLPLIVKYLKPGKIENLPYVYQLSTLKHNGHVSSLFHIALFIFRGDPCLKGVTIFMALDNQFLCLLPLLFSQLRLKNLTFQSQQEVWKKANINLSYLQNADTSCLKRIYFHGCTYDSLSPLSLCDISSLRSITAQSILWDKGFNPLNGLSSEITRSIKKLEVIDCCLEDLSPLSDCDLSLLTHITFSETISLTDLSPLRDCDLSSLKCFNIYNTQVSDISPLCECKGFHPEEIYLSNTPIQDLSPLNRLSDYAVLVFIRNTPAKEKLESRGLTPPQMVGNLTLEWRWR